jgi:hypothetical protein
MEMLSAAEACSDMTWFAKKAAHSFTLVVATEACLLATGDSDVFELSSIEGVIPKTEDLRNIEKILVATIPAHQTELRIWFIRLLSALRSTTRIAAQLQRAIPRAVQGLRKQLQSSRFRDTIQNFILPLHKQLQLQHNYMSEISKQVLQSEPSLMRQFLSQTLPFLAFVCTMLSASVTVISARDTSALFGSLCVLPIDLCGWKQLQAFVEGQIVHDGDLKAVTTQLVEAVSLLVSLVEWLMRQDAQ